MCVFLRIVENVKVTIKMCFTLNILWRALFMIAPNYVTIRTV